MKIIINKKTKKIIFASDDLSLTEAGVYGAIKGKKFTATNIKSDDYELIENVNMPFNFVGGFLQFTNGEVSIISEKETEYNNIISPVPQKISMRRARLCLLDKGLLSSIQTAIDSLQEPEKSAAQIEWDYSTQVWRQKTFVLSIAEGLGWTEVELDNLFREAVGVKYD